MEAEYKEKLYFFPLIPPLMCFILSFIAPQWFLFRLISVMPHSIIVCSLLFLQSPLMCLSHPHEAKSLTSTAIKII